MSAQIKLEHKEYSDILEHTQKGTMDVTAWMLWFLDCLGRAIGANVTLKAVLTKHGFGSELRICPSTTVGAPLSTACWTGSKASLRLQNTQS